MKWQVVNLLKTLTDQKFYINRPLSLHDWNKLKQKRTSLRDRQNWCAQKDKINSIRIFLFQLDINTFSYEESIDNIGIYIYIVSISMCYYNISDLSPRDDGFDSTR